MRNKEPITLESGDIDLHPVSKWNNIYVNPKEVLDIQYIGDNHLLMTVMDKAEDMNEYELTGFAATKLFRMTGVHKSKVHNDWHAALELGKERITPQYLLDAINGKAETDTMVLRELKEDESIRSIVGKSYIPIDMEELEAHVFKTILDNGIADVSIERFKSEYARGHDTTNVILSEIKRKTPRVGDLMSIGIQIHNNELGTRGISVCLYSERLACSNGMCHYSTEQLITETHLGNRNDILLKFDEACTKILDNAWKVLEWIDRASSIQMTWEQMNNYIDNLVAKDVISGKIADEIKTAINTGAYGSTEENLWCLINSITGVATHKASHGVKLELDKIASSLIDVKEIEQLSSKLEPVKCEKIKTIVSPTTDQ